MKFITITTIAVLILVAVVLWLACDNIKTVLITHSNKKLLKQYHYKMQQFEKSLSTWYPLGTDYFRISHGLNYYSFFQRLGQINFGLCISNNTIVATCCAIRRKLTTTNVWYICDLKVDKKFRGKRLAFKMLKTLAPKVGFGGQIYGISMNNNNNNKILKLAQRIPLMNLKSGGLLYIYSLDYKKMTIAKNIIKKHRGNISYLCLTGIKDLILKSTNKPMNILHVNWSTGTGNDTNSHYYQQPQENFTHMFCCPETDPMFYELCYNNITTDITATIIHSNMQKSDWKFILTSDI